MLNLINVDATTIADAWFQAVYKCLEVGRPFIIDKGSFEGQKRLEFDWITLNIKRPGLELLPKINPALNIPDPVAEGYLDGYLPYLMTGEEKVGEAYTYGQRICNTLFKLHDHQKNLMIFEDESIYDNRSTFIKTNIGDLFNGWLNQMELMIYTYKNKGHRNNQMILQVGQPSDMLLVDPPCLRHIDTRIQDNTLHFFPYFRSWDLWCGLPANLAAIEMMKQYCAAEIGVENGSIIATSKGLHLYDYVWELAEIMRGRTIEEFKERVMGK